MISSPFTIGSLLICLASLPLEQAHGQAPPPPPLGPRSTTPMGPDVPSSPSSTGDDGGLTGEWIQESKGPCWYDRNPANRTVCDGLVGRLTLTEEKGLVTGKYFQSSSNWMRPEPDKPYLKVNSDGSHSFDEATFDGTTLRLSVSYKLTPQPQEGITHTFVLTLDKENPNVLTGTHREEKLNPDGNDAGNFEVRFVREGAAPIVRVRDPKSGTWVPWILIPGIGWVLYNLARKVRRKEEKQPKEYELDIRTQDERTSINTDGDDVLWVYAQIRCNKPEVNTDLLTSEITFTTEGTDAEWLRLGSPERNNGFKAVPVRAWPPSENAQLAEGEATIKVSAVLEGSTISGAATLALEVYELEIF